MLPEKFGVYESGEKTSSFGSKTKELNVLSDQKKQEEAVVLKSFQMEFSGLQKEVGKDDVDTAVNGILDELRSMSFGTLSSEDQKAMKDYIVTEKLKTGENLVLEQKIQSFLLSSWKLKYLWDNAGPQFPKKSLVDLFQDIRQKEIEINKRNIPISSPKENGGASSVLGDFVDGLKGIADKLGNSFSTFVARAGDVLKGIQGPDQLRLAKIFRTVVEKKLLGKPYIRGASEGKGFDCSGFVSFLLREAGVLKKGERETSTSFYDKSTRIQAYSQVKSGDLLFWGPRGGGHVEMVVSPPYQKNGKWVVETIGSKRDGSHDRDAGVGYRTREIRSKFQFGRYIKG